MIVYGLIFTHCVTVWNGKKPVVCGVFCNSLGAEMCCTAFNESNPRDSFEAMTLNDFEDKHCEKINHGAQGRPGTIEGGLGGFDSDEELDDIPPTAA